MNLGQYGENKAADFLRQKDYQILAQNFRARVGEIDIICKKDNTLVFVEVKSRIGDQKGKPYESVTAYKLHHLKKAIYYYLISHKLLQSKLRTDVISIEFHGDLSIKNLQHFEDVQL